MLVFVICLGIGIGLIIWGAKRDDIYIYDAYYSYHRHQTPWQTIWGSVTTVASSLFIAICGLIALFTQCFKDVDYEKAIMQREVLVYRLENGGDYYTGNEELFNEVLDFNKMLYDSKRLSDNPWFNWYWNDKIADNIDYIQLLSKDKQAP